MGHTADTVVVPYTAEVVGAPLSRSEHQRQDRRGAVLAHTPSGPSDLTTDERIAGLLAGLEQVDIQPMPSARAGRRVLDLLGRIQTVAAAKMCDVTRTVTESSPDSDPVEVLRTKERLGRRFRFQGFRLDTTFRDPSSRVIQIYNPRCSIRL